MPGKLDDGALHSQADAQERDLPLACKADGFDFPLDPALAEPARHEQPVIAGEQPFRPFAFDQFALNPLDANCDKCAMPA